MVRLSRVISVSMTLALSAILSLATLSYVSHQIPWRLREAAALLVAAVIVATLVGLRLSRRPVWLAALWALIACSTAAVLQVHATRCIPSIWEDIDLSHPGLESVRAALASRDRRGARAALFAHFRAAPARGEASTFSMSRAGETAARAESWLEGSIILGRNPPFGVPDDLTWSEDPFDDWRFQFELHAMAYVSDLTRRYDETGDIRYLAYAEKLVLDWLADNQRSLWQIGRPNPQYGWDEDATAVRLRHWLVFWETWRRSPLMTAENMEVLLEGVLAHIHLLVSPDFYAETHNHGLNQDLAVIATTTLLPELEHAPAWFKLASERMQRQVAATIWPSGVHMEHTPQYQLHMMGILSGALRFGEAHNLSSIEALELPVLLGRMGEVLAQMVRPDRRLPEIGDTVPQDPLDLRDPMLTAVAERQPLLAYVLSAGFKGQRGEALSRVYGKEGYAILRDTWSPDVAGRIHLMLTAASNPGRGHKHEDDLSLTLYGLGRSLLVDPGPYKYLYGTPGRNFVRSPAAHNTVVVDGGQFVGWNPDREDWRDPSPVGHDTVIENWRDEGAIAFVTASHGNWSDYRHRRTVIFLRPKEFLVVDHLFPKTGPGAAHLFEQLWHFDSGANVEAGSGNATLRNAKERAPLLRITQLEAGRGAAEIVEGRLQPMQGWITAYRGDLIRAPVVVFRESGREALFVTQIDVGPEAHGASSTRWSIRREPHAVMLDSQGVRQALSIRVPITTREPVSWKGFTSQAAASGMGRALESGARRRGAAR